MKKIMKVIFSVFFIFTFLLGYQQVVKADDSLTITNWRIDSRLKENGDLHIQEDITFSFSKYFNGVFRNILLNKTSGIEDIKVKEIDSGKKDYEYRKVDRASKGDKGVYVIENNKDEYRVKVFSPSEDESKTFRISYTIKNVAIKYNDTGELYYNFIGKENENHIEKLRINLKLPYSFNREDVKIFGHGPLNGKINYGDGNLIKVKVEDIADNNNVTVRILFPKEFVKQSSNIVKKNKYDEIMSEEKAYAEDIKRKEQVEKKLGRLLYKISFVLSGFAIITLFISFFKFKRNRNLLNLDYNNYEMTDNTPAEVSFIMNKYVSTDSIMATILDLCRKGYLRIRQEGKDKYIDKEDKDKEEIQNFKITKIKDIDDKLKEHEKYFMNLLINDIGNGTFVTTKKIKKYGEKKDSDLEEKIYKWKDIIKNSIYGKEYFDKKAKKIGTKLLIIFVSFIVISIIALVYNALSGFVLLILSIYGIMYSSYLIGRKSDKGYIEYNKWKKFKIYIQSLNGSENIEDILKYSLDFSIVYSIALGLNKDIVDKFNIKEENSYKQQVFTNSWLYWYIIFGNNGDFNKSINSSFESTISPSTGSGGGFTGGGTGGAGGGGAGGF
ncbi:putative membrane protein [Gottschalkia purinilytica]|uniref:Putative membrane protein n=1 Tax=Gottschalkia purinilytica TaxID=1503 RepID=A0A0L0WEZ2_GOTPU|nr:DUF2207 domain-containing protein [Gottschalkia purinilytica]KNF09985.1 putative membrane protein [Gottschalkia purinilytica]